MTQVQKWRIARCCGGGEALVFSSSVSEDLNEDIKKNFKGEIRNSLHGPAIPATQENINIVKKILGISHIPMSNLSLYY